MENPLTTITLIADGPMIVKGNFTIKNPDSTTMQLSAEQQKQGVALCRCGRSNNKPLCDGSHAKKA